jgi:uncharacterized protein YkwD
MSAVKQSDRLGSVPTPRGRATGEVEPDVRETTRQATLPTQLSAPAVESIETQTLPSVPSQAETTGPLAPAPSRRWLTRPRQILRIIAIATVAVVLVGAGLLSRADAEARSAEVARAQAQAAAIDAIRVSNHVWQVRGATLTADAAGRTIAAAEADLAATPQAGDAPRAALQAAVVALRTALASPGSAIDATALTAAVAGVAAPQQAAVAAQTAWQVAEDARVAAAQAAAAQAAANAAAAKAASTRTTRTTRTTTSSSGSVAAGATATAMPTAGVEYSAGTIGAALNAFRASQGLPPMAIVRSAARVEHAQEMAASNSIWHSSVRTMWEIVGRVMPVSATAMIDAYANSPSHRAVMVGSFSTAYIGAVTYNGMLYTSIQCG